MRKKFTFYGKCSRAKVFLIAAVKMQRLLETKCDGYLIYAMKAEEAEKSVDRIHVFQDFSDNFWRKYREFHQIRKLNFEST